MTSIRHSPILAIIYSVFIHEIKSQLILCTGLSCTCPPASNPAVESGEMCVLDCGRADQCVGSVLTCRAGDPCYINCAGKSSCSDQTVINANGATDVTVRCSHEDACKTDIHITCGTGDCLLECVRFGSCLEFGWVDTRFSKSWGCNGMFCPWALLPLSYSPSPTPAPTLAPTSSPSPAPTSAPSFSPSRVPTNIPTSSPTLAPTQSPTQNPSLETAMPSQAPSKSPSKMPSVSPTRSPTKQPSVNPTINPTLSPTIDPTYNPTKSPSKSPTKEPTSEPSPAPTREPTTDPTKEPSREPTTIPTVSPTDPTDSPSNYPTPDPTDLPTWMPTMDPTEPSEAPTKAPIVAVDVEEARAAQFLQSPAWTALISILTMLCFCCCLILICLLCWRKYQKERDETQRQMDKMVTPETSSSRTDDRSADTNATHETDMQVVDGLETTGKMISVSELDLNVLHALNGFNRQDRKRMAATNGDKYGESKDFAIDPNLISAFMFGGGGDLNPMLMTDGIDGDGEILAGDGMDGDIDTGNPFRDGFEETQPDDYDNYNGNFINPFDDDEPNELQQADSLDEMGLLQQRMKLMKLLQQQYELMHDYNMHDQGQGQGHDKFDNRGDDNLMDPIKEDNELIDDHDHLHIGVMGHHGHMHGPADSIDVEQGFNGLL